MSSDLPYRWWMNCCLIQNWSTHQHYRNFSVIAEQITKKIFFFFFQCFIVHIYVFLGCPALVLSKVWCSKKAPDTLLCAKDTLLWKLRLDLSLVFSQWSTRATSSFWEYWAAIYCSSIFHVFQNQKFYLSLKHLIACGWKLLHTY